MAETRKDQLERRLLAIHDRVQRISNKEYRAAWVRGFRAEGELEPERERLLSDAERILDELFGKPTPPKPKE